MKIWSLESNRQWLDGGAMFGNAPKAMWSKWIKPDEDNRIPLACRCLLVDTGETKVLFELGVGVYMEPRIRDRYGIEGHENVLLKNLSKIGVAEEDIDFVIPSHLHFDHAGGLVPDWPASENDTWDIRFPNAKYILGAEQFQRALDPHQRDKASYIPILNEKLRDSDRTILISEETKQTDKRLDSWLSFLFADGHTPGLMHAIIKGKSKTFFFASDMIPGIHWVHTALSMGYDRYPEKSIDEKTDLLKEALKENWYLFYTHDNDFAASKVRLNAKNKFEATDCIKTFAGETI